MSTKTTLFCIIIALSAMLSPICGAQSGWKDYDGMDQVGISAADLRRDVEYLCDSICQGRAIGSGGHAEATATLIRHFQKEGLQPIRGSHLQSFTSAGKTGHNVIGIFRGSKAKSATSPRSYIVVASHYDHIGTINGRLYPGADANASGVAALMAIIRGMNYQSRRFSYPSDIIFVAFDSWCEGRAGSKAFIRALKNGFFKDPYTQQPITLSQIKAMIDIDQIGSNLAPVLPSRHDYLIAIGENSLPIRFHGLLHRCNWFYYSDLSLHYDYYGSQRFTQMFYHLGDRGTFIDAGIPTVYFTSGITNNNNTVHDTAQTLDYDLLERRSKLILRFIEKLL